MTRLSRTTASLSEPKPVSITITGSNFATGAPPPTVSFGADIFVTVNTVTSSSITVGLNFGPAAATGTAREVTVTNPDNKIGKLPKAFTVNP